MSGNSADRPSDGVPPRHSFASRGRRPLRVPIDQISHSSLYDQARSLAPSESSASVAPAPEPESDDELEVQVDWDRSSGIMHAVDDDCDPTEPSFRLEPDPLDPLGSVEIEPAIDVVFSDEPEPRPQSEPETPAESERPNAEPAIAIAFEMPQVPSEPPGSVRPAGGLSEPPEELHLDDAEVLSRSDIAPPLDDGTGVMIPIPKPPPPPVGTEDEPGAPAGEGLDDPWYETFFGQHYLRTVRTPTPKEVALECDVIERALNLPATSRLLDVGCGLGMHAVELAARGYPITGLDISETMISRANDEAVDRGLRIDFVRGDMRYTAFEEPFDGIVCWGTTLGYFSDHDNELALRRFHQSIKPGGVLLLEVVNRDFIIGLQPNQVWFEVEGAVCMEETDFNYETSRLRVKRRVASHDGKERDRVYSIRLYALHELRAMLDRNGFRCDEVSGREATPGVFFGAHSPKMIVRAERLPGAFTGEGIPTPPPVPKGALSEFPPDDLP